jgi:ketosteroid isomerase-like protein
MWWWRRAAQTPPKGGLPYCNTYCFVFRLADGKLAEVTEYMDSELVTCSAILECAFSVPRSCR